MVRSSLHFVQPPQSNHRLVAAEIHGQLTVDDMKQLVEKMQEVADRDETVLLYLDMQSYQGFELGVIGEKLKNMRMLWNSLERYAVIGAARWMETWIDIVDPLTPQKIKHFAPEDTGDAWRWLTESSEEELGAS